MNEAQVELESKLAFLEHTVDSLSEVLLEQSRTVELLQQRLTRLESRQSTAQEGEEPARDLLDDKPPHY